MAASGDRVLLLDADLRCPTLHHCFGLGRAPGLAECAGSQPSNERAIRQDLTTGVHFLAAGDAHLRPLGVLGLAQLRSQLDLWRTQFDAILIDSPPLLTAGDARILAQLSDYVIVVVRWGLTSWGALDRALRILQESGAQFAGIAVSRVDVRQLSAYDLPDPRIYGLDQRARVSVRRNGWGVDSAAGSSSLEVVPNRQLAADWGPHSQVKACRFCVAAGCDRRRPARGGPRRRPSFRAGCPCSGMANGAWRT